MTYITCHRRDKKRIALEVCQQKGPCKTSKEWMECMKKLMEGRRETNKT